MVLVFLFGMWFNPDLIIALEHENNRGTIFSKDNLGCMIRFVDTVNFRAELFVKDKSCNDVAALINKASKER